jgi:hypothetical protein
MANDLVTDRSNPHYDWVERNVVEFLDLARRRSAQDTPLEASERRTVYDLASLFESEDRDRRRLLWRALILLIPGTVLGLLTVFTWLIPDSRTPDSYLILAGLSLVTWICIAWALLESNLPPQREWVRFLLAILALISLTAGILFRVYYQAKLNPFVSPSEGSQTLKSSEYGSTLGIFGAFGLIVFGCYFLFLRRSRWWRDAALANELTTDFVVNTWPSSVSEELERCVAYARRPIDSTRHLPLSEQLYDDRQSSGSGDRYSNEIRELGREASTLAQESRAAGRKWDAAAVVLTSIAALGSAAAAGGLSAGLTDTWKTVVVISALVASALGAAAAGMGAPKKAGDALARSVQLEAFARECRHLVRSGLEGMDDRDRQQQASRMLEWRNSIEGVTAPTASSDAAQSQGGGGSGASGGLGDSGPSGPTSAATAGSTGPH